MERDDLQILPIPDDEGEWNLFLYDPMPGGSGLLEQFIEEWQEVHSSAKDLLGKCPNACANSCYDCLRTYYNQYYHEELDRYKALEVINRLGKEITGSNKIEPINEIPDEEETDEQTNIWEKRLKGIITEEWGFSGFVPQQKIDLPSINAWTKPDLVHKRKNIAIYLDGPKHNEPEQRQQDRMLRNSLRTKGDGWEVIEIPIQDAENDQMMDMYKKQIDRKLRENSG